MANRLPLKCICATEMKMANQEWVSDKGYRYCRNWGSSVYLCVVCNPRENENKAGYMFTFTDRQLYKEGSLFLLLPSNIQKILVLDDSIIIQIVPDEANEERNVLCYDFLGVLKWQIPSPIKVHRDNYYTGIYLRDGSLFAYSISGIEYHLDINSGLALESQLIK